MCIDHWVFGERSHTTEADTFKAMLWQGQVLWGMMVDALIAPRPHLALAGLRDKLTPVEGLDVVDREMQAVYAEAGHPERWKLLRYDVGHEETAGGRREVLAFLKTFLSEPPGGVAFRTGKV